MRPFNFIKFIAFQILFLSNITVFANEIKLASSTWEGKGEGAHGESGGLILGYDKHKNLLTGYYETFDSTGVGTNYCQFFLYGHLSKYPNEQPIWLKGTYRSFIEEDKYATPTIAHITVNSKNLSITLKRIPRSCEWLYEGLPQYVVPQSVRNSDQIKFEHERNGDWTQIRVIQAKRSHFYSDTTPRQKRKAYVVQGDIVYGYLEDKEWISVKHHSGGGSTTTGWIRQRDLMPIHLK